MKYPEELDIPDNIVQQIQISHNFIESYITIEEKDWSSLSYYNEDKDIIIVLVLDKYDDSSDYTIILDEFKKELQLDLKEKELKWHLERLFNLSLKVFRTRDEVIAKLSNEVAQLKTLEYDLKKKFAKIVNSDHLKVKSKIQFLLAINDELSHDELKKAVNTSRRWLNEVLETLIQNQIVVYDGKKDTYYLMF